MVYYIASDRFGNYDLCHHGILGQKWGIRRYQNLDGSLTAAGKTRYGSSGFSDKDAKMLEKKMRDLSKRKSAYEFRGSPKARSKYIQQTTKIRHEIAKTSIDLAKESEELSSLINNARDLSIKQQKAADEWASKESSVRKTATELLKWKLQRDPNYIGSEPYNGTVTKKMVDSYLKDAGIDAYSEMWQYHCDHTPELKKMQEDEFAARQNFRAASKDVYNKLLGTYGQTKLSSIGASSKYSKTVSEYLASTANGYLDDYIIWGESMFPEKKK